VGLAIKCTYRYRIYSLIGVPTYIVGLLLTTFFRGPSNPLVYVLFSQIVTGIGGGMFHVPVQLGIQAVAKHQEVAIATAMFLTFTSLGGSVGSAIAGAIWTGYLPECLEYYLPNMPAAERQRIFDDFEFAMSFPRGSPERDGIVSAYVDVMKRLTRTATLSALPMLIFVFAMKEVKLDRSKRTRTSVDSAAIDDEEEDEEVLGHDSTSRRQSLSRASIAQRRPSGPVRNESWWMMSSWIPRNRRDAEDS
jgi:MFS family permease